MSQGYRAEITLPKWISDYPKSTGHKRLSCLRLSSSFPCSDKNMKSKASKSNITSSVTVLRGANTTSQGGQSHVLQISGFFIITTKRCNCSNLSLSGY